jgi:hypothetical protein
MTHVARPNGRLVATGVTGLSRATRPIVRNARHFVCVGAIPTAIRSTTLMSLKFLPPTQRMQALAPPKAIYELAMDQALGAGSGQVGFKYGNAKCKLDECAGNLCVYTCSVLNPLWL